MTSPPSIFTQPSESVPAVELDGPSYFESTETGSTPFELPKTARLPRSRAASIVESERPAILELERKAIDAIGKASATGKGLNSDIQKRGGKRKAQATGSPETTETTTTTTSSKATSTSKQEKALWQRRESGEIDLDGSKNQRTSKAVAKGITAKRPQLHLTQLKAATDHGPNASSSLKRPAPPPSPRNLKPGRKIPRLSKDDSDLIKAFSPVDFAALHHRGAVSPLFFSNGPHTRPPLNRGFNSVEAGAQLYESASMEESVLVSGSVMGGVVGASIGSSGGSVASSGGSVRTMKMARGSLVPGSPPVANVGGGAAAAATTPAAAYSSMPRTPAFQVRHGMSRTPSSAGSRIFTPDPGIGDDRDKEALGGGMQTLNQSGVLDLFDQDDRPTFVLDLSYKTNFQPGALYISFANSALRAHAGLSESIRGRGGHGDTPAFSPTPSFPEFKAWVTSFVSNGEAMDVVLPSFNYASFVWRISTLKRRYRVVSGTLSNGSTLSIPGISTPGGSSRNPGSASHYEEPADYFGTATLLAPVQEASPENEKTESKAAPSLSIASGQASRKQQLSSSPAAGPASMVDQQEVASGQGPPSATGPESARDALGSPFGKSQELGFIQTDDNTSVATNDSSQFYFDWTRLPMSASLPRHIQFARSIDWSGTSLGPIETWSAHLRATTCLVMASPHPSAMYWGDDNVAIYNEPYILLAGQKHPHLMGTPYAVAWSEIWENVKDSFAQAKTTGQSTMKDDDRLFINRSGFLEETYFSWSIIPLVGDDGSVVGLYNPAFEKTRRKIAERRMLTLREVGEKTAAAREVKSFWGAVLKALEYNEYDTPFALLYSVSEDDNSDGSSIHSNSILGAKQVTLEGTLPELPADHPAAPATIDLRNGNEGFAPVFREAMLNDKHILLETANGTLHPELLDNMAWRGFNEKPRAAVVSPIHPTTGESIIGFLVMGINPRRPYDDDYNLFVTLLTRQLATSMASVVLFEEEIRRGQRAAKLAALDRIELSEQLAARTQEAIESETKFTRMAEFAPVGIFIANKEGDITFTNDVFRSLTHLPKHDSGDMWMELVKDEDKPLLENLWDDVVQKGMAKTAEIRFKGEWSDNSGGKGELWVLCSAFPEKYPDGSIKSIFGSLTDISQQKWAEGIQIKRTEEAVELKRQQSNFIDMTSHEMRNPLSAILQSADEIAGSLIEFKNSKEAASSNVPMDLIDSNIDAAQTIALCANHQTRIVSDVLTLSKLDSALLLVTPVDVQPKIIVQQALKMFEGEMQTADISLDLRIDKSVDEHGIDWVRLDPSRLLQVLINLMTNAIKFTTPEANRNIVISLEALKEPPSKDGKTRVKYIPRSSLQNRPVDGPDWGDGELIYLSFAVQDTGKGLNEDEKKLLFLRFSQANPKTHVRYGGSGLGLFISRELVELQGGEIGVSSESGKGSTFAFYIQARKTNAPSEDANGEEARNLAANGGMTGLLRKPSVTKSLRQSNSNSATASPTRLPSVPADEEGEDKTTVTANSAKAVKPDKEALSYLKILIVEDNLVNQRVLAKQLRNIGCQVIVANHGEECLTHLRKTKYWKQNAGKADALELSVILMDLEMPVMDGLTCTKRIREMERDGELVGHSPIIAVSANARSAHVDSAIEAGMDDVVSKPFRVPELVPKMEQLVQTHRNGGEPQTQEE